MDLIVPVAPFVIPVFFHILVEIIIFASTAKYIKFGSPFV